MFSIVIKDSLLPELIQGWRVHDALLVGRKLGHGGLLGQPSPEVRLH